MGMISVTELRGGKKFLIDGELFNVIKYEHHKPGKGRTVVRIKCKSLKTGLSLDKTYSHSDSVEEADVQMRKMQYLYEENSKYVFMDLGSYEQHEINADLLGDQVHYLKPEAEVTATLYDNRPIGLDLPLKMEFEVVDTTEAVRGNTATNVTKDATIDTGFVIQVPLFVKIGDRVRIRTEDGSYVERAN